MRGNNAGPRYRRQGDRPTVPVTEVLPAFAPYRRPLPLQDRLAYVLGRLPSRFRRLVTAVLLLAAAEMHVIGRSGDGHLDRTPTLGLVFLAPLIAAVAAIMLKTLGGLIHRTARLLGGSGHYDATTEVVGLLAAIMLLPSAVVRLGAPTADVTPIVDMVAAVAALVVVTYVVGSLEGVGRIRAVLALLLPGGLVVALLIMLSLLLTAADDLPLVSMVAAPNGQRRGGRDG
jgi:hypothetical protein